MRLKRIDANDDSATATWHGDDAVPFAAIDPFAGNNGASLAWQTAPDRLIGDVLALHRVPALLAERLLVAAEAARHRPAVARATLGQENAPEASDPLRDLAAALGDCLSFATFSGLWRTGSLALVGPPGVGKTTLAGKLAARARSRRPILVNTDAKRAGATAQLVEFSGVLGVAIGTAGDAEALARSLRGRRRRVIIDTSGVNPFDRQAVDVLAGLVRSARAEPVLVLPANVEPDEAVEIVQAFRALPIRRLLATRLDIVRRLGGLLAAASAGDYAIVGGSVTPHFTYGLRPLTPIVLARRLVGAAFDDKHWTTQ